jgi:hypothetical protein
MTERHTHPMKAPFLPKGKGRERHLHFGIVLARGYTRRRFSSQQKGGNRTPNSQNPTTPGGARAGPCARGARTTGLELCHICLTNQT